MAPEGTVILLCITGASAPCLPFLPSAAKQLPALGLPRGGDGEYTTYHTPLSTPKTSFFRVFAEKYEEKPFFLKDVFQGRFRDSLFFIPLDIQSRNPTWTQNAIKKICIL